MRTATRGAWVVAMVIASWASGAGMARAQDRTTASAEATEAACRDRIDDDGDGAIDCADVECAAFVFCARASDARVSPRVAADETETRSLVWLQVWGAVMWAVVYGVGIGVTAGVGGAANEVGIDAIPLAGPWLCLGGFCAHPGPYAVGLVTDGILQALGLVFLIAGSATRIERPARRLAVTPWGGLAGIGAVLTIPF